MSKDKKSKDRNFVVCLVVTALIGMIAIVAKENYLLLLYYIPFMAIAIPCLYFNYSLCKWENRWHARWNEKNPCDGEPSDFRLTMGKIAEWFLFVLALGSALLPSLPF